MCIVKLQMISTYGIVIHVNRVVLALALEFCFVFILFTKRQLLCLTNVEVLHLFVK